MATCPTNTLLHGYTWLVVSNIFYFPFHIWDVILPIDFHIFQDGYCTTSQILKVSRPFWATFTSPKSKNAQDAEGSIYLSSINGVIYKFNQHGKELWQTNTGRGHGWPWPSLKDGIVILGQDDHMLDLGQTKTETLWLHWLVVWNMNLMTFHLLGMSSSQLTFTPSFFRGLGGSTTNQLQVLTEICNLCCSIIWPIWGMMCFFLLL